MWKGLGLAGHTAGFLQQAGALLASMSRLILSLPAPALPAHPPALPCRPAHSPPRSASEEDWSDDEDVSWKVRRAAAKAVSAVITHFPDLLGEVRSGGWGRWC